MREPSAGDLRDRLVIRGWQDQPTGFAELQPDYGEPLRRWAMIVPARGALYWGSKQVDTGVTHVICLRYLADLTAQSVVEAGGQRYRVLRVKHVKGAKRWTWLDCELLGAS